MLFFVWDQLMVSIVTLLLVLLLHSIFGWYKKFAECKNAALQFPCLPKHWFWGNLEELRSPDGFLSYTRKMMERQCQTFCCWFSFLYPGIYIAHPDAVKTLIRSAEPKPMVAPGYVFVYPWLGNGLLLSTGKKWERNRRLLTPAFHFDILKSYIPIYNSATDKLISKFSAATEENCVVDVIRPFSFATLDIMLRCSLSYTEDIQDKENHHPYVTAVTTIGDLLAKRLVNVFHYSDWIYRLSADGRKFHEMCKVIHEFSDSIIHARQETLKANPDMMKGKKRLDFLDILVTARDSDGVGLSNLEIRNEVDTFMFEGHDTTACSLSWMLYAMAANPDEQENVYNELQNVLQNRTEVTWDDLSELRYLTACLKESIRLFTTVPIISRRLTRPFEIDGKVIPAEMTVSINIYAMHHNPDIWSEPEEFRPSRFLSDDQSPKNPYMYIPFSAGPRNCIGQNFAMHEMKVMMAKIIQTFEISADPTYQPEPIPEMVLRSRTGIRVKLKRRKR